MNESDTHMARDRMVAHQIAARGIRDSLVLDALRSVPREDFVPPSQRSYAYDDGALPIGRGQTISQPYVVAKMTAALRLRGGERVLEIGTGSGYAAAILARIAGTVHTIERIDELARFAVANLRRAGCTNVRVHCGDGSLGWPEAAPYDAIVVTAGGPSIPDALVAQLAPTGRLVMPVGPSLDEQVLVRLTRTDDGELVRDTLDEVRFVPLIGEQAWAEGFASRPWGPGG